MTGVAVSGGADSIFLLHHFLAQGLPVTVLHVNHQLRGEESSADEQFVRSLGVPVLVYQGPILEGGHLHGGNLEEAAREERYRWFRQLICDGTVERVALGHTRSDQAETVLFRFLRGAGTAGLAGIRPITDTGFFRPLLHMTRQQIRESLLARGIAWREDSSNAEVRFARNRLRHELLPLLQSQWNPRIEQALSQTAEWALAEEAYWHHEVTRLSADYFLWTPPYLTIRSPDALPLAVRRRLIRHAIETVKGNLRQIDFGHVEAVLALRRGRTSLPGLTVERSFDWLRLSLYPAPGPRLDAPFQYTFQSPAAQSNFELRLVPAESVYNTNEHHLDWERFSGPLVIRNWHPGDRYRRIGRDNEEKLKVLFQKARIPVWERRSWPVLVCGGHIAWARRFGPAASVARGPHTRTVLIVRETAGFPNLNA